MKRLALFLLVCMSLFWIQVSAVHALDNDDSYQPIPEGRLHFIDGVSPATFELALDQVWVRPAGKRAFVESIDALASNAALYHFVSAREAAAPDDECGMVAYLAGKPRNDSTIRFVTRKVTVQLKEEARTIEHANAIAAELGMQHQRDSISLSGWTVFFSMNSADSMPMAKIVNDHPLVLNAHAMIGFRAATKSCADTQANAIFVPNDPVHIDQNALRFGIMNIPNVWVNADPFFGLPLLLRPYAGFGRVVAVSDDGVDWDHEDLINNTNRTGQFDYIAGDQDPDDNGVHGTNVAGIIYGEGANGIGISGVVPKARGAGIRWDIGITDDENITRVIGHKAYKFDVHNASWGMPDGSLVASSPGPLTLDELKFKSVGSRPLPYVFQAGNGNLNNNADPDGNVILDLSTYDGFANDMHTIAVASASAFLDNQEDTTGEAGSNIICAAFPPNATTAIDNEYEDIDDFSSFAAPVVSGIVALMAEARAASGLDRLGWRDYQEILIATSSGGGRFNSGIPAPFLEFPYSWSHLTESIGYGVVDAFQAVRFAEFWPKLPSSGTDYRSVKRSKRPRDNINGLESYTFNFSNLRNLRIEHAQVRLQWAEGSDAAPATVQLYCPTGLFDWELNPYWSELSSSGGSAIKHRSSFVDIPEDYTFTSVGHWGQLSAGTPVAADPLGFATHDGVWRVDVGHANGRRLERIDVIFHGTVPNTPSQIVSADLISSGDPTVINPERVTDSEDLAITNVVILDPEYQDPTLAYQWQKLQPDGVTWSDVTGASGEVSGPCDWEPIADFSFSPVFARAGEEVQFSSTSRDPGGELVSWEWDFGDGNTSEDENPVHVFEETAGAFSSVTLTVTDNTGNTNTFSRFITILEPDEPAPDLEPAFFPNFGTGIGFFDGEVPLPAASIVAESAYRVVIRPNDGSRDGVPRIFPETEADGGFFNASTFVAVNSTPVTEARVGEPYLYDVGLWITNQPPGEFPDFFKVNEVSQGVLGNEVNGEWVELMTVVETDMRGYHLTNNLAGFDLTFTEADLWSAIPAGTLITIYNSDYRDGVLPPDDFDLSDGVLTIGSSNENYFILPSNGDRWGEVSNINPAHIAILDRYCRPIHGVSWNEDETYEIQFEQLRDGESAHSSADSLAGFATGWVVGTAEQPPSDTPVPPEAGTEGVTPGLINDTNNALVRDEVIGLNLTSIPSYSLAQPAPAWLSIEPGTGILTGTPSNDDAGVVTVTVIRSHSFATETQTFDITVLGSPALPALEDEDEDGIINMLEVAFGTDPEALTSAADGLPVVSQFSVPNLPFPPSNFLAISFRRMKGGDMNFGNMTYTWVSPAGDTYLYQVESSLDLFEWGVEPGLLLQESVVDTADDSDNVETATYRTVAPLGEPSTLYLRLSVTVNPE